jgi:hypothetical protein
MQKLLTLLTLVFILGLAACNKDEEEPSGTLSKTEAKAKINEFSSEATQELQDLSSSEGLKGIVDLSSFMESDDPFGGRSGTDKKKLKAFLRKKGNAFRRIVDSKYLGAGRSKEDAFDFDAHTGVYSWSVTEEIWSRTADSNIIEMQFPSEGSTSNNAKLLLETYEETGFYDEELDETIYEPTVLEASLLVDGTEIASLDFDIDWSEDGTPIAANLNATVVPFSGSVQFDITANDKNTLSATLKRDDKTLFSTSVDVLYSDPGKSDEDIKTVSGHIQFISLKLKGSIDVEGMDASQDGNLNDFVLLELLADERKVGNIIFETEEIDGMEEAVAYIEYADGTKEKLEDVLKPVTDELEEIEEDING